MSSENSNMIPRLISDVRQLISAYLTRELKKAGCVGIVPSHGEIIFNLINNREMTMTELSDAISKDRSTVTTLVGKLIKRGMVEYRENPEDLRSKKVALTENGKKLEKDFLQISQNMNRILWQGVSQKDKEVFIKVLRKAKDNFSGDI